MKRDMACDPANVVNFSCAHEAVPAHSEGALKLVAIAHDPVEADPGTSTVRQSEFRRFWSSLGQKAGDPASLHRPDEGLELDLSGPSLQGRGVAGRRLQEDILLACKGADASIISFHCAIEHSDVKMHKGLKGLLSFVWRLWGGASPKKGPEVFLHDPAAAKPHNLDDPFYDAKVQEKVGKILAGRQ